MKKHNICLILVAGLAACSPTVRLATPEPVKIDVNMKVDVVTREEKKSSSSTGDVQLTPREARRKRMSEVQGLKNNRVVGEKNDGLLAIVEAAKDPSYQSYAEKVVKAENSDRKAIFESESKLQGKPAEVIAKEWAKRAISGSFPGEWVQDEKGKWTKQ